MSVYLGKWPAMTVVGQPVRPEQAGEILVRTNRWSLGCNDRSWERSVWTELGVEVPPNGSPPTWESIAAAQERLGVLELNYLRNDRIMTCAWIGPHGWCHWDGTIGCSNYNIGKWPEVEEVRDEWAVIAEAFPFLGLTCQLWSGETSELETHPVIEYRVRDGQVVVLEPKLGGRVPEESSDQGFNRPGCTLETLRTALNQVRAKMRSL